MVLGEILACPSAKHLKEINFCLLDVSDGQRIQRLMNRTPKDVTQTMLNWASWLRMHTQTPQWEQHVLKENAWNQLDFTSWDTLSSWKTVAKTTVIDTTTLTLPQTAQALFDWLEERADS